MSKNCENRCPGCRKHCPMGAERCKYGKKYFMKAAAPAIERRKWDRYTQSGGTAWQLFDAARSMKKALKSGSVSESALLGAISEQEQAQLCALLGRLGSAAQNASSAR